MAPPRCGAWPKDRADLSGGGAPRRSRRRQRAVRRHPGQPVGVTFTVHDYADDFTLIGHPDHKIALEIPAMLQELAKLSSGPPRLTTEEFPIVLSVGSGAPIPPTTSSATRPGANAMPRARCGSASKTPRPSGWPTGAAPGSAPRRAAPKATVEISETMLAGHAALPNGFGLDYVGDDGRTVVPGVAPNALTSTQWRDPTPAHRGTSTSRRGSNPCPSVPDLDPPVGLQEQRALVGTLEGIVEGVHVADHAVAAELRR